MRGSLLVITLVLFALPSYAARSTPSPSPPVTLHTKSARGASHPQRERALAAPLTLEQAIVLAEQRNPSLQAALSSVAAAQGELNDTRALLRNNPQITAESRRRTLSQTGAADALRYDSAIGVSQTFELAGQQQARRRAAEAGRRAVEQSIEDTRRDIRAETAQRFVQVLNLHERVQMEEQALDLLQRADDSVHKQIKSGEESRLNGNLALIEAERSANDVARVKEQLIQARADLSTSLQLDSHSAPDVIGTLDATPAPYELNDLLASAGKRPRLQMLDWKERAARSRLDVEHRAAYPDLTVGLSYSPEKGVDSEDHITTLSFSLPLPLFNRNSTGIGHAKAEMEQARVEHTAAARNMPAAVTALWRRLQSLQRRVKRLQTVVLPRLEENQELSLKALRAGEIGLSQFLLVRRQAIDGRRDLLDARTELSLARIEIENAAGWPAHLPPIGASSQSSGRQ